MMITKTKQKSCKLFICFIIIIIIIIFDMRNIIVVMIAFKMF